MSIAIGGIEIPLWKTALSIALAGFAIVGTDVKEQTEVNAERIQQMQQIDASSLQWRTDIRRELDLLRTDMNYRFNRLEGLPSEGGDVSPIVEQLNRIEARQRQQQKDIDSIYNHLSPRRSR